MNRVQLTICNQLKQKIEELQKENSALRAKVREGDVKNRVRTSFMGGAGLCVMINLLSALQEKANMTGLSDDQKFAKYVSQIAMLEEELDQTKKFLKVGQAVRIFLQP